MFIVESPRILDFCFCTLYIFIALYVYGSTHLFSLRPVTECTEGCYILSRGECGQVPKNEYLFVNFTKENQLY